MVSSVWRQKFWKRAPSTSPHLPGKKPVQCSAAPAPTSASSKSLIDPPGQSLYIMTPAKRTLHQNSGRQLKAQSGPSSEGLLVSTGISLSVSLSLALLLNCLSPWYLCTYNYHENCDLLNSIELQPAYHFSLNNVLCAHSGVSAADNVQLYDYQINHLQSYPR